MKGLLISTNQQDKLIQNETERRRTLRLLQTRQIEKQRAAQLRQTVADEKKKRTYLLINQLKPDYEHEWLRKTLDNDARAIERGQQALDKLHVDMMQNENERNLHILHRKAALELEKVRAQQIAKLPAPEDPLRDLQMKPSK
ncbi:unnamed protein product [Rotaria sp. Silwood1]|nr:unnamed protein product [Rotaria sp. Silwood1]CAF3384221.1 unnamed protein product [Rotaria sp. Silwood1]CAF4691642.1 unnamed protein product [Rotaria sp. Silwood1]CAF4987903.1 unnamed protein product [Rotaria sp. Silwood1]